MGVHMVMAALCPWISLELDCLGSPAHSKGRSGEKIADHPELLVIEMNNRIEEVFYLDE